MIEVNLPNDPGQPDGRWRPREHQRELWRYLMNGGKRAIGVWHRRSGKDETCLQWMAIAAHERIGTYWYMLPEASQARKAIWEAIDPHRNIRRLDIVFPRAIRKRTRNSDMFTELLCGSTFQVVGSDNYNSLVGSPPIGIVFSEWALGDPQAWGYLKPILEENGGWAVFNTTARGPNHAKRMFDAALGDDTWHASLIPIEKSGALNELERARIRREYIELYGDVMGAALYEQEYECSFEAAVLGAVYGKEMKEAREEGRIGVVPYDRSASVETWWDIGYRDPVAIWFVQRIGAELHAIDYYENHLEGIDHYAKVLQDRGYVYSRHLAPHDAGKGEIGSGKTLLQQASAIGLRLERQALAPLIPGINATRPVIARMRFDATKCQRGIDALTNYRYDWDPSRKTLSPQPLHDWSSHGADALRTGAVARDAVRSVKPVRKLKRL